MKTARLIPVIILPLFFACLPPKPEIPLTPAPAGPLLQALERHRQSFSSLKAVASVEVVKRGRRRSFDTVGFVIDEQRRFRMEAYGPLGQSLMAIVWDGREVLLRLPGDEAVTQPGPAGLERLLGQGLEPSELCPLLSGNIPAANEQAAASLLCDQNGDYCILELRQNEIIRRVRVHYQASGSGQDPRVVSYELYRSGKLLYEARFNRVEEISHYLLPMQIVIENPDQNLQLTVLYNDIDVNVPISEEAFILRDEAETINTK